MPFDLSEGHVGQAFAQARDGHSSDYFFVLASGGGPQQLPQRGLGKPLPPSPLSGGGGGGGGGGEASVRLLSKGKLAEDERGTLVGIRMLLAEEQAAYLVLKVNGRILLAQSLGASLK